MLKEQADEAIATYPYSEVPEHWRRLYMDATLLYVIARLMDNSQLLKELDLLELVRLLDMANIVTAYFERGREEILFSLLSVVQSELSFNQTASEPPAKKQRRHGKSPARSSPPSLSHNSLLLPGITAIKTYTVDNAPDINELSSHIEPFIVKGAVLDWPAASSENAWSSSDYLLKVAGRGRIVPVEIGSSYTAEGWTQKMMGFDEFLRKIRWDDKITKTEKNEIEDVDEEPVLYLAQHDLFQQFPDLSADILVPDYVYSDPGPPDYFPDYHPPNVPSGYTKNAWMGPKNTYSPAHTDPYYNCYGELYGSSVYTRHVTNLLLPLKAQVVGSKHIWVAPPQCGHIMEGNIPDQSEIQKGDQDKDSDDDDADNDDDQRNAAAQQFMDNTAQIDVFKASVQKEDGLCSAQTKLFQKEVLPSARQAILEQGDLLFMPPK